MRGNTVTSVEQTAGCLTYRTLNSAWWWWQPYQQATQARFSLKLDSGYLTSQHVMQCRLIFWAFRAQLHQISKKHFVCTSGRNMSNPFKPCGLWPIHAYTMSAVFQASLLMSGLLEMEASASSPSSSSFDSSWAQYDQEVALAELSQPPFEGFQATKTAVVRKQPPKLSLKPFLDYRLCREGIT